jgi:HEAT repeat protein
MKSLRFSLLAIFTCFAFVLFSGCSKKAGGGAADLTKLRADLKSTDQQAVQDACVALADMKKDAKGAIPELIPLLDENNALTRRLAAYALGQIGPDAKAAVPKLKTLMVDPDMQVMTTAINAVQSIDPKEAEGVKVQNTMN